MNKKNYTQLDDMNQPHRRNGTAPPSPAHTRWSIVVGDGYIFFRWNPVGLRLLPNHFSHFVKEKTASCLFPMSEMSYEYMSRFFLKEEGDGRLYNLISMRYRDGWWHTRTEKVKTRESFVFCRFLTCSSFTTKKKILDTHMCVCVCVVIRRLFKGLEGYRLLPFSNRTEF